jgi:hypothetical protein
MELIVGMGLALLAGVSAAAPRVEPLREADVNSGCGCSFHIPPSAEARGAMILQWEVGSPANLRVDGKLQRLLVRTREQATQSTRPDQVGDKTVFDLTGKGVNARAVCTVIKVCKPEDEACEVTVYRAKISVRTPAGTTVLDTWAACGC